MLTELTGFRIDDALERFGGDENTFLKYARMVVKEFEGRMSTLRDLQAAQDVAKLQSMLHTLKGSAACVSATALFGLCERAEKACKAGQLLEVPALLNDIQASLDHTRNALERM